MQIIFSPSSFSCRILPCLWWLISPCFLFAQGIDTMKVYRIPEVIVSEHFRDAEIRSTAPLQILSAKQIEKLNVLQVSDALKHFSGVTVKDYGGIGGLKTISVRSLGANHTAVSYDGITLTDCQTGQIDLGRFSLENVDMLSLNSGQADNIFQPARLFASGSVLNIRTFSPRFIGNKKINGKASMKAGSFGLLNPSLWLEGKISHKISASFSGEWLSANGEYPYLLDYGIPGKDSSSMEIRKNTDVQNFRLEGALYGNFSKRGNGNLKTYYYQSERGLPGATILYNAENFSSQRIWDNTFFSQAHYEIGLSKIFDFQANAKYNRSYMCYLDPTYLDSVGKLESTFLQEEYYGSVALLYRAFENLSFAVSSDGFINTLDADFKKETNTFINPTRYSWISSFATKYVSNQLLATASILSTIVTETVNARHAGKTHNRLSPFFSLSVKPFLNHDFRLRAFYKSIFRIPTFNDLYYEQIGNRNLKPENANQYNLGLTYSVSIGKWLPLLSVTLDGYHNEVTDKIVAYPTKNIFVWSMLNLGKVKIDGLDMTAETTISPCKKIGIVLGTSYTYQRVLNVTNPTDRDYRNQLPYTPRISGSGRVAVETQWINLAYSVLWSGHRYSLFQNYQENRLPGFTDHSLSVSHSLQTKKQLLTFNIEFLNMLNKNYAVVKWFPMPGRSFRATVSVKF